MDTTPIEQPLDEDAITTAVADFSAKLARLDAERVQRQAAHVVTRRTAQDRFDQTGLPRGLYYIERVA